MKKTEIIETLKENYNRDLRKQVVKTILAQEKESSTPNYQVINQIFSYVIKELNWKIEENIQDWDYTPLDIMEEAFPRIESTKWYEEQLLSLKKILAGDLKD
ncbi:MAG: hypothetical protein DRQ78_09920 [Epsilonproteobacteria bacterium]|nr:MAG: hypothetical protein DRQ78_09920 [Campylobacterota bacterium]